MNGSIKAGSSKGVAGRIRILGTRGALVAAGLRIVTLVGLLMLESAMLSLLVAIVIVVSSLIDLLRKHSLFTAVVTGGSRALGDAMLVNFLEDDMLSDLL